MKSSSHLTRAVFRAITNNRPYRVAECHHQPRRLLSSRARPLLPYTQKRTRMFDAIFGTVDRGFEGAKNTPKNLEIALGKLVDAVRARRTRSRSPPHAEVVDALKFLFASRLDSQHRLTRNEVYIATEVFKHLQENGLVADGPGGETLTRKDLDTILKALALPSDREIFRSDTKALATMIFAALPSTANADAATNSNSESAALLPVYATILARTGSSLDAFKLLQQATAQNATHDVGVWIEVLKGLASEGLTKDFNSALQKMQSQFAALSVSEYGELIAFFASIDNFEEAKRVYESQTASNIQASTKELDTLLRLCVRAGQSEFGRPIAQLIENRAGEEDVLGSLFVWAAASKPGSEDLKQEISRLLRLSPQETLTMSPFNQLIELAYSTNKPEMASSVVDVAQSIGLQPDGKFYALQLQYAVQRGDIAGGTEIYEQLIRQDIPADGSDVEALNKFVTAIAFSPDPDYSLLMRVIDNLLERNADFDAEALAGICQVFLQYDELEDLTGLLRHRVDFYPGPDRARISAIFQQFIVDSSVKDQRAFNAYDLFRTAFPETPIEQRLTLMRSFFERNRSDLACLVFGHMRQREDVEARPTPDAYAKCFEGIAQRRDIDGLQMVYNMLKLDLEVEVNTKVRNGLMLAYTSCQMPFTAMIDHFWKIIDSKEGPSYSTFLAALRACESWIPQGGYEARKVMAIVQAWDLEITKDLYDCYVGAIAGQSEFENTVQLIEEMEEDIGERPDVFTIGTFYNAIPWQYRKDEVEKWAKKAYPDLWEELQTFGDEIDEEWEIRYFKIDRSIDIDDPPLFADGAYDPQISRDAIQALEPPPEKPQPAEGSL